jgi:hypothetical protein
MPSIDLFQKWRIANQAAMLAAKATFVKAVLALDGKGEPPSQTETDEVRTLRGLADDLFELAMARMGEAVSARQPADRPESQFPATWFDTSLS